MTDPQSGVFHESTQDDWTEADLVDHPDGTLDDLEPEPVKTVDEYEAEEWDSELAGPKTLDEARENLAARINDPHAPDTKDEASAYDGPPGDDAFADDGGQ